MIILLNCNYICNIALLGPSGAAADNKLQLLERGGGRVHSLACMLSKLS